MAKENVAPAVTSAHRQSAETAAPRKFAFSAPASVLPVSDQDPFDLRMFAVSKFMSSTEAGATAMHAPKATIGADQKNQRYHFILLDAHQIRHALQLSIMLLLGLVKKIQDELYLCCRE